MATAWSAAGPGASSASMKPFMQPSSMRSDQGTAGVVRWRGKNCYVRRMAITSTTLASGPGWRVLDVCCTTGPADPVFEEQHGSYCLAAVVSGTFQYRSSTGRALLAPGAVLLGNQGQCFECGHAHGRGDRCVSVHFEAACWEDLVAAVP